MGKGMRAQAHLTSLFTQLLSSVVRLLLVFLSLRFSSTETLGFIKKKAGEEWDRGEPVWPSGKALGW